LALLAVKLSDVGLLMNIEVDFRLSEWEPRGARRGAEGNRPEVRGRRGLGEAQSVMYGSNPLDGRLS